MATINLNIKDTMIAEVVTAVCANHNYQAILLNGTANTETRGQFANRMLLEATQSEVVRYRQAQAMAAISAQDSSL